MSELGRIAEDLEKRIKLLEDSQDEFSTSVIEINKKINMLNDYISNTHQTLNLLITNVNKKYENQRNVQIKAMHSRNIKKNEDTDTSSSSSDSNSDDEKIKKNNHNNRNNRNNRNNTNNKNNIMIDRNEENDNRKKVSNKRFIL